MNSFSINVQINVGITPALESLLTRLLQPSAKPTVTAQPIAAVSQPKEAVKEEKPVVEQPAAEQEAAAKPVVEQPEYGPEYIRRVIDRTRQRFEGENYKNDTASDLYKKYHRPLTAEFKKIAMFISANSENPTEKPTMLTGEDCKRFSDACDELIVGEDGNIVTKVPF